MSKLQHLLEKHPFKEEIDGSLTFSEELVNDVKTFLRASPVVLASFCIRYGVLRDRVAKKDSHLLFVEGELMKKVALDVDFLHEMASVLFKDEGGFFYFSHGFKEVNVKTLFSLNSSFSESYKIRAVFSETMKKEMTKTSSFYIDTVKRDKANWHNQTVLTMKSTKDFFRVL